MARRPVAEKENAIGAVTGVFREFGYEGTSLTRLTEATGLIKASLYHRFPEGKEQMAEAALCAVDAEFVGSVLAPLFRAGDPAERLQETTRQLRRFYGSGKLNCLLETLTVAGAPAHIRAHARRTFRVWTKAFADIAIECGMSEQQARRGAEDAIAAVEGALILCRVSGSLAHFDRALASLPGHLGVALTLHTGTAIRSREP